MSRFRAVGLLIALLLVGGSLGFYLVRSAQGPESGADDPAGQSPRAEESAGGQEMSRTVPPLKAGARAIPYPRGAVEGEMNLQFASEEDYRNYLAQLREAGLEVLGQVDELRIVRVSEKVLFALDPLPYGARPEFSYRVEQPPLPEKRTPEVVAGLLGYGRSARSIIGQPLEGDGSGVLVGVLDSGITANALFDDVYIVNIDLVGGGVSGPGAEHGTSVASIISGAEGVAPRAELLVVRVLDDEGIGNSFQVAEGIVQAVDMGVGVINLSLGLYEDSRVLREAVRYAEDKGVLIVAAAGNDGYGRLPYPAAYPEVIAVTAIDASERQAHFPNQSEEIDFAAPGVGILAAQDEDETTLFTGTSAAAPFVTGTIAALLSAEPGMTPRQIVETLKKYRNEAGAGGVDAVYGGGILDFNRVRERKTAGIPDLALAEIYLDPKTLPGTTAPVTVTVENRGTRWLSGARMEVVVDRGDPVEFSIETLGPGQTASRQVFTQLPSGHDGRSLEVVALTTTEQVVDDVRPRNNRKAISFRPPAAE